MDHSALRTLEDGPQGRIPCRRGRPPGLQPVCRIGWAAVWLCGLALLLSGCPQPAAAPNTDKGELVVTNSDACSELLHDLCERLLLYWAAHRDLPQLDEKLYLEVFAPPETITPRRTSARR